MARNQKQQREASEFEERVVYINRVSKTVKGGRRMSLVALVVVGDGKGNVGVGMGKSAEVPLAISKASLDAKKNMFHVPVTEQGTIPHEVLGHFGAGRIIIKPLSRYRRYRRRRCASPLRACWHQERPVQVPRYRQRPQHHQGCRRGPQGALQP